jgi:hypothetical protein
MLLLFLCVDYSMVEFEELRAQMDIFTSRKATKWVVCRGLATTLVPAKKDTYLL